MSSLREIGATHGPLLVLDAASAVIQVGWLEGVRRSDSPDSARWQTSTDEAGIGLFRCIESLALDLGAVGAFVFCDGPGSILGVRTVAMALRTWQALAARPMFAYSSLALVAHALAQPNVGVIADARRDSWHRYQLGGSLQRVATGELSGELVMPENFRHWSALPSRVTRTPYLLAELLPKIPDADLFRPIAAPDAFLHEEPSYVTWTPQVHRAP